MQSFVASYASSAMAAPTHVPVMKTERPAVRAESRPSLPPLLPRVAAGDELAVRECLSRYGNLVFSIARRFSRDARDAEDACQDIFVALWRSAASYDPARAEEATFVALIARRRLIDRGRTPGTRAIPNALPEPGPSGTAMEAYVDARIAVAALEECSEAQRRVVMLAALHGFTHEEIARELSLPLGTVKSHYARGIERVKRALSAREERQ